MANNVQITQPLNTFKVQETNSIEREALNLIDSYKKELASYGLYVCSGMELEFVTSDQHGNPASEAIKDLYTWRVLNEHIFPHVYSADTYIRSVNYEDENSIRKSLYHHEIKIGEPLVIDEPKTKQNPLSFSADNVAATTAMIKKQTLAEVLRSSTCLTTPENGIIVPNFAARFPVPGYQSLTSGLHVNMSLFDQKGNNLFLGHSDLKRHCAEALLEVQRDATLAMLPEEDSLKRIKANQTTPYGIGISLGHAERKIAGGDDDYISIRLMHNRLENRLPGADANPIVAMAVTMAALVDAVRKHVHKSESGEISIDPYITKAIENHDIPKSHQELVEQYRAASRMKGLLGQKFYDAILQEYGQEQVQAR